MGKPTSFSNLFVLFTGALSNFVHQNAAPSPPFLENTESGPPAFLYLGSGKETVLKMTELPERMMTSLLKQHVNSLRRQQGGGVEKQESERT